MTHHCDACTDREGNPRRILPKSFLDYLRKKYPSLMASQDEQDRQCPKFRGLPPTLDCPPDPPPPSRPNPMDYEKVGPFSKKLEFGSFKSPPPLSFFHRATHVQEELKEQTRASAALKERFERVNNQLRSSQVLLEQVYKLQDQMHNIGEIPFPCEVGDEYKSRRKCHGMKRYQVVAVRDLVPAGEMGADQTKDCVVLAWKEPMTIDGAKVTSFAGDITIDRAISVDLETLKKDFSKVIKT